MGFNPRPREAGDACFFQPSGSMIFPLSFREPSQNNLIYNLLPFTVFLLIIPPERLFLFANTSGIICKLLVRACIPPSKHQGAFWIIRCFCSLVFNTILPVRTKKVESQTVLFGVKNLQKPMPQIRPLRWIDEALKHRVLDPLSIVLADFRHAPQSPGSSFRSRVNVVSYQNHHDSHTYFQRKGG